MAPPTVGVLDDEPEMRKALRRLLTSRGFQVVEFGHGSEVLDAAHPLALDCLLLDLHMEGVSGFEVMESFSARPLHPPVIVITAHDEPGTAERVRSLGAVAYLKKPVDRDALLEALEVAMHHRSATRP
ncbi:MAG: response regulator [Verrucomicrobia bacterium]|nr:response regulator [Verrucomicrobiota bacterium]